MINDADVVLLVARASRQVISPVQLQKAVFLVSRADLDGLPEQIYAFQPYHYGPFDSDVYSDAEKLHMQELLLRSPSRNGAWTDTIITPKGWERTDELHSELPDGTVNQIEQIVRTVQALEFSELLRHIYDKHPDFQINSVFQY